MLHNENINYNLNNNNNITVFQETKEKAKKVFKIHYTKYFVF